MRFRFSTTIEADSTAEAIRRFYALGLAGVHDLCWDVDPQDPDPDDPLAAVAIRERDE